MQNILSFFLITGICFACTSQKEIHCFTTDKCSCYPEGPKFNPHKWEHCCISHDSIYWKGGGTRRDRKYADMLLRDCIKKTGAEGNAKLMYLGVRLGGGRLMPFPWRWGYGWGYFQRKRINTDTCKPSNWEAKTFTEGIEIK